MGHHSSFSPTPDVFFSSAKEQTHIDQLQEELKRVVRDCYPSLEKLEQVIESRGLPVIANGPELPIKMAMMLVGVRPGYISAQHPRYEEFVETLLKQMPHKAHLDYSRGMLLLFKDHYHFSNLTYELYHWVASQSKLPGYRDIDRKNYHEMNTRHAGHPGEKFLETLDLDQTNGLRHAIRRDREALQFVRRMMHEVFIPANNSKLLDSGDAQA